MKLETVRIPSGNTHLAGLLYHPVRAQRETAIVYAHGFTSGKYSMDGLAGYLAGRGFLGLTFDFVGHKLGATGGELHNMAQIVENLRDALYWMQANSPARQIVLIGHSMGGAASLAVAAEERTNPESPLGGLACLCIGLNPSQGFVGMIGQTMLTQRADYITGAPASELMTQLDEVVLAARELPPLPTLFIAARQDVLVPVSRVEALAALAPHATVTHLDTSHLEAPDRARNTLLDWLATV